VWNDLTAASWSFRGHSEPAALRDVLSARFAAVPEPLVLLLAGAQGAVSPDETTWFLNAADYAGSGQPAFEWNAWERLSLETAGSDEEWSDSIRAFWAVHVPFLMSVRGRYSYVALALAGDNAGAVVHGCEPEFEDVTVVARSIDAFAAEVKAVFAGTAAVTDVSRLLLGNAAG